jgi:hypothetical protein
MTRKVEPVVDERTNYEDTSQQEMMGQAWQKYQQSQSKQRQYKPQSRKPKFR